MTRRCTTAARRASTSATVRACRSRMRSASPAVCSRSRSSQSSSANHSVSRANASVPIRTRRAVPSLSRRMRWTYQRSTSVSRSTGTDTPSTGSWPSWSQAGSTAWSKCTRRPPRGKRMSTTEPIGTPSDPEHGLAGQNHARGRLHRRAHRRLASTRSTTPPVLAAPTSTRKATPVRAVAASSALTLTPALDETAGLMVHAPQRVDCSTILQ